jgi:deazaflavin-dependent oxidoreductase (nitroreductase family)
MSQPTKQSIEIEFFRMLNRVAEPMVRAGFGSPRVVPGGLLVLEHTGRKSGRRLRTPLAATRIQGHVVIGTFRGEQSQWVRNLAERPEARVFIGGSPRELKAFVMHPGKRFREPRTLPTTLRWVVRFLAPYTRAGWAFAVLSPRAPRRHRAC